MADGDCELCGQLGAGDAANAVSAEELLLRSAQRFEN
jgi:hypothetical protein